MDENTIMYCAGLQLIQYDLEKKTQKIFTLQIPNGNSISCMSLAPGKDQVAIGTSSSSAAASVHLIDLHSGKLNKTLKVGDSARRVIAVSFSKDGKSIYAQVSGPECNNLYAWTIEKYKFLFASITANDTEEIGGMSCNQFLSDSRFSISTSTGLKIFKIQENALKLVHHYKSELDTDAHCWVDVNRVCVAVKGKIILIDNGQLVSEVSYGKEVHNEGQELLGTSIAAYHNGLLVGCSDGTALLYTKLDNYPFYEVKEQRKLDKAAPVCISWSEREDRAIILTKSKSLVLFQIESSSTVLFNLITERKHCD